MIPIVSVYKNAKSTVADTETQITRVLQNIKDGYWEDKIHKLRTATDEEEQKLIKLSLPAFTPSGTFQKRTDNEITDYSGIVVIDIDHVENINEVFVKVCKMPFTFSAFRSCRGHGICVLFRVKSKSHKLHKDYFNAISEYFLEQNIVIDPSGSNLSRLRFVSYDPDLYLNENAELWGKTLKSKTVDKRFLPSILHTESDVESIFEQIKNSGKDLTNDSYLTWLELLFAIESKYGQEGFPYAHAISCNSSKYSYEKTEKQYEACLRHKGSGITIATLFYHAKQSGLKIKSERTKTIISASKSGSKNHTNVAGVAKTLQITKAIDLTDDEAKLVESILANPDLVKSSEDELPFIEVLEMFIKGAYELTFNEVTKKNELNGVPMTDRDLNNIYLNAKKNIEKGVTKQDVDAIIGSNTIQSVNPLKKFIEANSNYGKDEVSVTQILQCLPESKFDDNFFYRWLFFEKWYLGIIHSIFGGYNELCLTLVGDVQGTGKTRFFKDLLPPELTCYYTKSEMREQPSDFYRLLSSKLLVLLDEFSHKKSIDEIKAILSSDKFNNRRAYGRFDEDEVRLASFCATTNNTAFLDDLTGNRRFVAFNIESDIDFAIYDKVDKTRLFMHFYWMYQEGARPFISRKEIELLNQTTLTNQVGSVELDLIESYLEPYNFDAQGEVMNLGDVLNYLSNWSGGQRLDKKQVKNALYKLGFEYKVWRIDPQTLKKGYKLKRKTIIQ